MSDILIPTLLTLLLLAAAAIAYLIWRQRPSTRWRIVPFTGEFSAEHHFPDHVPVPPADVERFEEGDISFDEVIEWMQKFLKEVKKHPLREQIELAVQKAGFYDELSDMMGRGRWGEVDELASKLAKLDPKDPSAAVMRGRANRELGKYTNAIEFYKEALKLRPTHSTALPELAATCRIAGQPHRAQDALEAARKELGETHPLTIESRVALGELVRVFADPTDAATVAHIPRDQYVRNVRSRMEDAEPDLDSALNAARSMLSEDMPELAEALAEKCNQWYGEPPQSSIIQAMLHRHVREFDEAIDLLSEILENDDSADARLELARTLLEKARVRRSRFDALTDQARGELRLAIERDPDLTEAVALLVRPHPEVPIEDAEEHLHQLVKAYPEAWGPWKVLGDLHAVEERWAHASKAYERALDREQADETLVPYLGVLAQMDAEPEMLDTVQRINELSERDPLLRWRCAQVLFKNGRIEAAKNLLEGIVDEEGAPPPMRQQARDVLSRIEQDDKSDAEKDNADEEKADENEPPARDRE